MTLKRSCEVLVEVVSVDIAKPWNAADAHTYLRMMMVYNNLIALTQFAHMIPSNESPYVIAGLSGFVSNQIISYCSEAVKAFVEEPLSKGALNALITIRPTGTKLAKVIDLVYDASTSQLIRDGKPVARPVLHEQFQKFRNCRNSIGFHLDHKSNSSATQAIMRQMQTLQNSDPDFDTCAITFSSDGLQRFPLADKVWENHRLRLLGCPLEDAINSPEFKKFYAYYSHFTLALMDYLGSFAEEWILANKRELPDAFTIAMDAFKDDTAHDTDPGR
jgi:hypothetical protein